MAAPITQKTETKGRPPEKKEFFTIVRIMQTDIPGNKNLLTGFTYLKGISWAISNALCRYMNLNPKKKIIELTPKEIEEITKFIQTELGKKLPNYMLNRRKDFETGEDYHLTGTDLDMKREFDIRRLKKIRSYRGLRHATGQPTRGQRTKSHFRNKKKNKAVGVNKKKPGK